MTRRWPDMLGAILMFVTAALATAQEKPSAPAAERALRRLPGAQPGGLTLLPNQWSLKPAGKHLVVGDFPVTIALHPLENVAAVLHAGYGEHEVVTVDLDKLAVISRVAISETFVGLTFAPDGKTLFASGAGQEIVHRFAYEKGYLSDRREIRIADPKEKHVPAGLATSGDGATLYVACPWGNSVEMLQTADPAADRRQVRLQDDDYPYLPLPVAGWQAALREPVGTRGGGGDRLGEAGDGRHLVRRFASDRNGAIARWRTALRRLFEFDVRPRDRDGDGQDAGGDPRGALCRKPTTAARPNSLSLSPDGKVLLIANADNNNVAVVDVSDKGRSRSLGFIPVGWYPTSVRFGRKGDKIYVPTARECCRRPIGKGPDRATSRHEP